MQGKAPVTLNKKTVLAVLIGVVGALLFGLGFCLCVVFTGYFIYGIIAAIAGIALLLCLIPLCGKLE
jgi:CDP-diglyceride synthetase